MDFSELKLSKSHQKVADYISKQTDGIPYMTEKEIGEATGVSIATVSRFWRAAGFENLREFKAQLKKELAVTPASKVQSAVRKSSENLTEPVFAQTLDFLKETYKHLDDEQLSIIVDQLTKARRVHIYGSGSSKGLVQLLGFRLRRYGMTVMELAPSGHELYEDLIHMDQSDMMIVFGFVRSSPEIDVLFDYSQEIQMQSLLITDMLVSPLLHLADHVLYTNRGEIADFHSMVAPVALMETLIIMIGRKLQEGGLEKLHQLHHLRKTYQRRLPKE